LITLAGRKLHPNGSTLSASIVDSNAALRTGGFEQMLNIKSRWLLIDTCKHRCMTRLETMLR
jgi:hypothetical protein